MTDHGRHTISLYVANKPGVLNRIAQVFARRGYNIDSLVVSESTNADYSYMNIVASGDGETLVQIIKQLNKLIDVVSAKDYSLEDVIQKELALFKINCPPEKRTEVLQIAQTFKAVSEDLTATTLTLMVTGKSEKIDALKEMLIPYGVLELVRTGKVLISRGDHRTSQN
jgi:acetolactate synthase-1/3 small subunit